jgi:hypothetical protein
MSRIGRRTLALGGATLLAAASLPRDAAAAVDAAEARILAQEAFLYFYPLISMEITRRVMGNAPAGRAIGAGPANQFQHARAFPAADFRDVVRPNFDTLYSSAWFDLSGGPVVISAPDTAGRYYLLPMLDMWSNVFASPGKRTSGTAAADWVLVPPGWTQPVPDRFARIDAPTPQGWIIGRIQTNGPADYPAVHRVQDGLRIVPLAAWGQGSWAPPAVAMDPAIDMSPPLRQVDGMAADRYFALAAELLRRHPPQPTDWSQLARLARIGIRRGRDFAMPADPALRAAIAEGAADGLKLMETAAPGIAPIVNGWQMNTSTMGVYGNFYLKRAIVAQLGLGANQPEDAIYPLCVVDQEGRKVTAENRYVLRFERGRQPPVEAFWSLTMYDAEGFQVANPLNRFAIGDRDALQPGPDGAIELLIQHADPGEAGRANWLPAPASGELGLTLRLYAPRAEALDGRWTPPALRRV